MVTKKEGKTLLKKHNGDQTDLQFVTGVNVWVTTFRCDENDDRVFPAEIITKPGFPDAIWNWSQILKLGRTNKFRHSFMEARKEIKANGKKLDVQAIVTMAHALEVEEEEQQALGEDDVWMMDYIGLDDDDADYVGEKQYDGKLEDQKSSLGEDQYNAAYTRTQKFFQPKILEVCIILFKMFFVTNFVVDCPQDHCR